MSNQQEYDDFGQQRYQINTSKVVKGHKITMKDLINKKRIKSKRSSPTKVNQQLTELTTLAPRITQFSQKYKGLETLDDQQSLYRFIIYQREKQSRQSARGIKLFSCQKRLDSIDEDSFVTNHFSFSARNAKTSQSSRKPYSALGSHSQNKTVSYEQPDEYVNKVIYQSNNIGNRMNEYLNIVLQKKDKAELIIKEDEIKEEVQLFKLKNQLVNQVRVMNKNIKIKSNNFYRQMKKNKRNRIQSAKVITQKPSNQLVKSLMRRTAQPTDQNPLSIDKKFLKSFSQKVRTTQKMKASATKSFYSSKDGQESTTVRMNNILTLINN